MSKSKPNSKSDSNSFSFDDRKNIVEIIGTALQAIDMEERELRAATGGMQENLEDLLDNVDKEKVFELHARFNKRLGALRTLRMAITAYLLEVFGDGITEEEEKAAEIALSSLENTIISTEDEEGNREVVSGGKKMDRQ